MECALIVAGVGSLLMKKEGGVRRREILSARGPISPWETGRSRKVGASAHNDATSGTKPSLNDHSLSSGDALSFFFLTSHEPKVSYESAIIRCSICSLSAVAAAAAAHDGAWLAGDSGWSCWEMGERVTGRLDEPGSLQPCEGPQHMTR